MKLLFTIFVNIREEAELERLKNPVDNIVSFPLSISLSLSFLFLKRVDVCLVWDSLALSRLPRVSRRANEKSKLLVYARSDARKSS